MKIENYKDLLQNNRMAPKVPFLPIIHQKPRYRTRGTPRQPLTGSEQKSSLLESKAYYARGLKLKISARLACLYAAAALISLLLVMLPTPVWAAEENGSVGIEGTISAPPPKTGATISIPSSGQNFTQLPVTVSGLCPDGLLVKVFKNNVFSGSVLCQGGSYSIVIDLFGGRNDLVARVFDDLDQPGPDSNLVSVNFEDRSTNLPGQRVTLTSNFAKRGANPGQALTWPIILSGGNGPYAISVDWGDGQPADLISQAFPGTFDISHTYDNPGVYNIIIKATDRDGGTAFLQLVGVANGSLSQQDAEQEQSPTIIRTRTLWWPGALLIPLILAAYWLGKRSELHALRQRLERRSR